MNIDINQLLEVAKKASLKAGEEIMDVYNSFSEISHQTKQDDHSSPLTQADTRGDEVIKHTLSATEIPILSEEGQDIPYSERSEWEYFWLVDPLDGTKEFIKKNGEFTVNIALIHQGQPVLGVVYVPAQEVIYYATQAGSFSEDAQGRSRQLRVTNFSLADTGLKVVGSRSHMNPETEEFISRLNNPEVVSMGSSLKLVLVAAGKADIYPRFGPTMEWDTAAAHAVVKFAGGSVIDKTTDQELVYNKQNLLNPFFIVWGNKS